MYDGCIGIAKGREVTVNPPESCVKFPLIPGSQEPTILGLILQQSMILVCR